MSKPAKNHVGNSSVSKGFDQVERASANHRHLSSDFARISENDVNVCKQISSL